MQRHLWLNLAQLPDKEKVPLQDAPVTATGLFGVAVVAMREVRKRFRRTLRNVVPRQPGSRYHVSQAETHQLPQQSAQQVESTVPQTAAGGHFKPRSRSAGDLKAERGWPRHSQAGCDTDLQESLSKLSVAPHYNEQLHCTPQHTPCPPV